MVLRNRISTFVCIFLVSGCAHIQPHPTLLRNSFEAISIFSATNLSFNKNQCVKLIPPVIDVPGITFYKDSDGFKSGHASIVDPEKQAIRNALVKPISDFNLQIDQLADQIWVERGSNPSTVTCFLNQLYSWASQNALLGDATDQGVFERNWALSGLSLAYLKARPFLGPDSEKHERIQRWFEKIANKVQNSFDEHLDRVSRKNNLSVWAALAVQTTGVISDNIELFRWGLEKVKSNITTVDENGFLPNELIRGQRSLHYHCFELQPLMMSAFLASSNSEDLFLISGGALDRLAQATIESLEHPEKIQKLTGFKQELPDKRAKSWIEIYHYLRPQKVSLALVSSIRPADEKWLGGSLTLLFGR